MKCRNARSACRRHGLIAALSLLLAQGVSAGPLNSQDEALFRQFADPSFYAYPHRREAVADVLAIAETLLAAGDGYRRPSDAMPILQGNPSKALRMIAAGGGRAGETARIMLREAEVGMYGDPNRPIRGHVPASEAAVEFRIPPNVTSRLVLGSSGSGRVLFGSTCRMQLRELPRDAHGQSDVHGDGGQSLDTSAWDSATYVLETPTTTFGVTPLVGCGAAEQTLFAAWAPSPPQLQPDADGKVMIRAPGRYEIALGEDGTQLNFDLPVAGYFEVSSPDQGVQLEVIGPRAQGRQWIKGGRDVGRISAQNRRRADLVVAALEFPRVVPGEVLQPDGQSTAMLFEVFMPDSARGYLRLETLPGAVDGDPVLYAFDSGGEMVANDDDGGEGANALLELPVTPGAAQTFALIDISDTGLQPVQISLSDTPLDSEGE